MVIYEKKLSNIMATFFFKFGNDRLIIAFNIGKDLIKERSTTP
jgi:hypothetical protein